MNAIADVAPQLGHTIQLVIKYAGKGFKQVEIARAVGVEESYVSQILNTPEYAELVEKVAVAQSEENDKFDHQLDTLEARALGIVDRKLSQATDMKTALLAATKLNAMKRRRDTAPATRQPAQAVVNLILPQIAQVQYVANKQAEIIEVEGRTMLSAQPGNLEALAKKVLGRELKQAQDPALPPPQDMRAEVILQQIEQAPKRRRSSNLSVDDLI